MSSTLLHPNTLLAQSAYAWRVIVYEVRTVIVANSIVKLED